MAGIDGLETVTSFFCTMMLVLAIFMAGMFLDFTLLKLIEVLRQIRDRMKP